MYLGFDSPFADLKKNSASLLILMTNIEKLLRQKIGFQMFLLQYTGY